MLQAREHCTMDRWRWLSTCLALLAGSTCAGLSLEKERLSRREWLVTAAAASASVAMPNTALAKPTLGPQVEPATAAAQGRFFFPALTPPFKNRATYRYELGRNMWALEQLLTFANVTATIRTNVVRMDDGGLWVHGPLYPTGEYCTLLDELGPVRHVVLPCNAFEHKAPLQAFCKKYPQASVWIAPGQYGPLGKCGLGLDEPCQMGTRITGIFDLPGTLPGAGVLPPWIDEFDYTTLYVNLPENAGPVSEVAFVHKPSKTLIVTDAVVYIPRGPVPPIFGTYFESNVMQDPTFWARTVLQAVFLPLRADPADGSYPGFEAIAERLVRAPILRGFNDARAPEEIRAFVQRVCDWTTWDRLVSSHFASPILATTSDLQQAFAYLQDDGDWSKLPPLACQDWELLDGLNDVIAQNKLGAPATFDYTRGCLK